LFSNTQLSTAVADAVPFPADQEQNYISRKEALGHSGHKSAAPDSRHDRGQLMQILGLFRTGIGRLDETA
jgi:hypothetical protein